MKYTEELHSAWVTATITLNPSLYTDCEDEDEVEELIWDDIWRQVNYGDVHVEDSTPSFTIPDEFWNEWKKLKSWK